MNTFEITIQPQPRNKAYYPVVVEYTQPDSLLPIQIEGKLEFDEETQRQLKRLILKPKEYGEILGELLFNDRKLYGAFREACNSKGLRILLAVEARELSDIHWERLAVPVDDDRLVVLARSQNYPFSLSLASSRGKRFPPMGQHDLRALVVVARPANCKEIGLAEFDHETAIQNIQAALGNIPNYLLAAVTGAKRPTVGNLLAALTETDYPLLHLVAHGKYLKDEKETIVYLVNEDNLAEPIMASALIDRLFGLSKVPRFAFLVTCESGTPDAEDERSLGSLGKRLVRELGMHAVVAMTDKVTITTAMALAPTFYKRLREHGYPDLALVEAGYFGLMDRPDMESIVPVLFSRLRGRPLYSDAAGRPPTDAEIKAGLEWLSDLLASRAPILLEHFTVLRPLLEQSLGGTMEQAKRERGEVLRLIDEICYEVLDFSFADLARGKKPSDYQATCPFPGLKAFGLPDDPESQATQKFFFGRKALVDELEQMVVQHPFLAVLGASGSGKSSLVMAGLVPALQAKQPDLQVAYLKPGSQPAQALDTALTPFAHSNLPLLIVVDQFEELFTQADEKERQIFLTKLLTNVFLSAPQNPKSKIQNPTSNIILTMRTDFTGDCAPYDHLATLLGQHTKLIPPMKPEELREAISQQAEAVKLRFDPDLINTIMEDVVGEPGAMPLLQHALRLLWDRRHGRWLRANAYRDLGGIQKAIAQTATKLYDTLSPVEQIQVRAIFTSLIRLDDSGLTGDERRDTRRRVFFKDLVPSGHDTSQLRQLVEKLANARLMTTNWDEASGQQTVEVVHEALIRHWPLLRGWLDENREVLRLRQDIEEAAQKWVKAPSEDLILHRGGRLTQIEALRVEGKLVLAEQSQHYIEACIALREDELQQAKERAAELEHLLTQAQQQTRIARATELAVQSQTTPPLLPIRRLLLALEATNVLKPGDPYRPAPAQALRDALRNPLGRPLAGHNASIIAAAFSPDGQWLATSSADKTARLWSVADPEASPCVLAGHEESVTAVAFSPDGRWLATASADKTARLWSVADPQAEPRVLIGHEDSVTGAVFNPDGRWLVTASADKTARLWSVADPQAEPRVLVGHDELISAVSFNPDGQWLATASADKTARLWSVADPQVNPRVLVGHEDSVVAAAFSPDGQWLATSSADKTARLWSVADPEANPRVLVGHQASVTAVAFSPDGRWLATASADKTARLWSVADPQAEPRVLIGHEAAVKCVIFSPNSQGLATVSEDSTARLWSVADLRAELLVLRGHEDWINAVAFSPDDQWLATASKDSTTRLWSVTDPQAEPRILIGHWDSVAAVAFSPDGQWLATAGEDSTTRLWSVANPQAKPHVLVGHEDSIAAVTFSPDGQWLATASDDRTAGLWSVVDPQAEPRILVGHENSVVAVAFSPDSQWLVTASADKTARLWSVTNLQAAPRVLIGHWDSVTAVAFSPDGQWLVTASADKTARLWSVTNLQAAPRVLASHEDLIAAVAFSPDGQWLVTASKDKTARLWSVTDPQAKPYVLTGHEDLITAVAFSPDGQWLATTGQDRTARLWSVTDPQVEPRVLIGHWDSITTAAFSPNNPQSTDSPWLATVGWDKTIQLWSVTNPQAEPLVLVSHEGRINAVAFSPDGRWLATASADSTVRLWRMHLPDLQTLAGHLVGRNLTLAEWQQYFLGQIYRRTCSIWPAHASVIKAILVKARDHARLGQIEAALVGYQQAQALDPELEISAAEWFTLGQYGNG